MGKHINAELVILWILNIRVFLLVLLLFICFCHEQPGPILELSWPHFAVLDILSVVYEN